MVENSVLIAIGWRRPSAMALASTFAGNRFLAGSLANSIVMEQAAKANVRISWREHAGVGIPVTLLMLALAAGWLWLWHSLLI